MFRSFATSLSLSRRGGRAVAGPDATGRAGRSSSTALAGGGGSSGGRSSTKAKLASPLRIAATTFSLRVSGVFSADFFRRFASTLSLAMANGGITDGDGYGDLELLL